MRVFREPEPDYSKEALTFALGAAGGLMIGLLMSQRTSSHRAGRLGNELRERARQAGERARTAVRRMEPARLQRMAREETELTELEDVVLEAFFGDSILSERGVDVGAISQGIIELSGSVWTREEAERAVRVANTVPGVRTVVNRLIVEDEERSGPAGRANENGSVRTIQREVSRTGGMGSRRQSWETDPDRRDDSQHFEQRALRRADRDQWAEEGYAAVNPRTSGHSDDDPARTRYSEDELDNQDPHGKHASLTLDSQPRDMNTSARVGESPKPGTELELEQSGLRAESTSDDGESDDRN